MGPFPLSDECRMIGAIAMLDRSLDPGHYADHVQFGASFLKRSFHNHEDFIQAGVGGLED